MHTHGPPPPTYLRDTSIGRQQRPQQVRVRCVTHLAAALQRLHACQRTDHFICLGACEETSVRVAHIAYAKLLQRLVQPADGERIAHGVAY